MGDAISGSPAWAAASATPAGFANFSSIAIQMGAIGGLARERRDDVVRHGLKALLAGRLVNLANAAIAASSPARRSAALPCARANGAALVPAP